MALIDIKVGTQDIKLNSKAITAIVANKEGTKYIPVLYALPKSEYKITIPGSPFNTAQACLVAMKIYIENGGEV